MRITLHFPRSFRLAASIGSLAVLASTCVLHAASGTWDGSESNLLNTPENWSSNTLPDGSQNVATWDGTANINLSLSWTGNWTRSTGSANGTRILVTSGQSGSLALTKSGGTGDLNFDTFTVENGAGAVSVGVGGESFQVVFRGGPSFTNNSSNTVTFGSSITAWASGGGLDRNAVFGGSGNWQISGNYTNSGNGAMSLTKNGAGTLTFNGNQNGGLNTGGANTLSTITINQGTVKFGASAQLGSPSVPNTYGVYTSTITNDGTFEWASSANQTLSGTMSGSGRVVQSGAGTLTLSGDNTYTGGNVITGGVLRVGHANALGATSGSMTVNNGTLNLNGQSVTVGALSGSNGGLITSGTAGAITLTANQSTTTTYAGIIQNGSGTVAFIKQGSGTLTLSGNNTYTGNTTVTMGTLIVSGGLSGGTIVNGGVLAGTGSLQGIDLASGAISPGTAGTPIGTLEAISLTLENTPSSFNFDLSASDNTSDRITLTGAFNGGTGAYTFNFSGGMENQTYTLLSFDSTNFTDVSQFFSAGVAGTFALGESSLTFTTVPEPSTIAMLGGGLMVVLIFRRRSRAA